MKTKWLAGLLCSMLVIMLLFSGCGENKSEKAVEQNYLTINDDLGRSVTLTKPPVRIVALSPSFLELLGAVDAKLVGRPTSNNKVPEFAKAVDEVGLVTNINVEKVVSLQPDLVIAYKGMHDKYIQVLESNNIPVIVLQMKTYNEVQEKLKLFADITGQQTKGEQIGKEMQAKVDAVVAKLPEKSKKIAILHSSAKTVTIEMETSIAGSTAKLLKLDNVTGRQVSQGKKMDTVPYSLEKLVETNPDMIFVVTMGKMEDVKKRMLEDVESSPAWSSLTAVQKHQVHFLPQEYFLLNPGINYPEAIELMAKLAYPEVWGNAK